MYNASDAVDLDIDSEEFNAHSAEVQHELLTLVKETHRRRYKTGKNRELMPDVCSHCI